jgi:PA14 domain
MTGMTGSKLSERPGWEQLRRAADELHAAELLIGDPLASPRTAVPHLREFWTELVAAGLAAGLAKPDAREPETWLRSCEIAGLDDRERTALLDHWRALQNAGEPHARTMRAHARSARALLGRMEPIIGGVPLYSRKRRARWAAVGVAIVLLPVAAYTALNTEIPGEGPWHATYFSDRKLENQATIEREADINHDWNKDAPLEALPPDKFSARWDTCLRIDEADEVILQVHANDGARVYVDGETVIDAWEKSPITRKRGFGSAELTLEPGVHHLQIEYFESLGAASIKFAASFDGELPVPLPNDRLLYPGDDFDEDDPCAAVR